MLEYIIVSLVSIVIILEVIILIKNKSKKHDDMLERMGKLETNITKEIGEFKYSFTRVINEDFNKLNDSLPVHYLNKSGILALKEILVSLT